MQFLLFLMFCQKSIIIIMSFLEAVTISGFKKFSPHSYQTLEFTGPLTLISGKGGSGKSTILQVLNYVLTSSLRNQRQKCHPTDPRLVDQLLMKAQARLKFRNSSGKTFIACRVVNAIPFRKMTLKQAILGFKHQGKQHDIDYNDSKGKQMDEAIFHLLNTSRSFLDFVVFSHQAQQPYFFNNLALNFFDVLGIRQFGELINSLEEQQNYFQIQSGKLRKSMIQAKKLYDHDVQMKKSSLAVLQKISDRFMQLDNKIEQSTQIETSIHQDNDEDAVQIVEIKRKAKRKRQGTKIKQQIKKQNYTALQDFKQKAQMDLAANIAFQQYNRPIETRYLYLKMHSSIHQLTSQDLKTTIQALYDSLNEILSHKMMEINQIMNEILGQIYEGNDILQIKMSLSDTSPQYRKDRVSFSIIRIGSQNEYCMLTYCSLSQLVLASIAIRVALILVLSPDKKLLIMDSPTSNLSKDQTRRLARYLCKLIQAGNIQVIIASNDQQFNSLLAEKVSSTYEMSLSDSMFNIATKRQENA